MHFIDCWMLANGHRCQKQHNWHDRWHWHDYQHHWHHYKYHQHHHWCNHHRHHHKHHWNSDHIHPHKHHWHSHHLHHHKHHWHHQHSHTINILKGNSVRILSVMWIIAPRTSTHNNWSERNIFKGFLRGCLQGNVSPSKWIRICGRPAVSLCNYVSRDAAVCHFVFCLQWMLTESIIFLTRLRLRNSYPPNCC